MNGQKIAIGDIVSATGSIVAPRNDGKPPHPIEAPDGPFRVTGFFGNYARLLHVTVDPDTTPKDDIQYQGWPIDQLVKN